MRKRQRKKWLKQHGKYVPYSDLWNLDITIANFVLPRLKKFKEKNDGYPGREEMDTPEKWNEALDKMILAFEYVIHEFDWWIDTEIKKSHFDEDKRRQAVIDEGLQLFVKWFRYLWI